MYHPRDVFSAEGLEEYYRHVHNIKKAVGFFVSNADDLHLGALDQGQSDLIDSMAIAVQSWMKTGDGEKMEPLFDRIIPKYEKQFTRPIFYGNQSCEYKLQLVRNIVEKIANLCSAMQQLPHSNSEESAQRAEQWHTEAEENLRLMQEDIAMALHFPEYDWEGNLIK